MDCLGARVLCDIIPGAIAKMHCSSCAIFSEMHSLPQCEDLRSQMYQWVLKCSIADVKFSTFQTIVPTPTD